MSTTPSPAPRRRRRPAIRTAAAAAAVLALTAGCGGDAEQLYEDALSFGFPDPVTDRAESVFSLWLGSTAAALVVGAFVTALILFAVVRYRKTSDDMPRQVRYNLPVEVLYTVVPFVIIAVLFYYTVVSQNTVNALTTEAEGGPDVEITVVGFQWNWQFQHTEAGVQVTGSPDQDTLPQLVLPVGKKIRIVEESPDVIHSFYVPKFLFKRDVIPGRANTFEFVIEKEGEYVGRCAEFCGERHYAMNFSVLAVTPEEYAAYLETLQGDPDAEILNPGATEPGTEAENLLVTLIAGASAPVQTRRPKSAPGSAIGKIITTTDHKTIGILYLTTSFVFFLLAGAMAMVIRAELAQPGLQVVSPEQYNQLFTMHGTIMMFLFAPAAAFGFANFIMPLQIGAPDMSFPRLNAFSYWLYLFGGTTVVAGFLTPEGAASFGWFAYAPLNSIIHSPHLGADLWIVGLAVSGLGTILGGVNFITTIITLRAPGMTMFRMPIFTWNILVTSILVIMAFPVLAGALMALLADRQLGAQIYNPDSGGAILWQHLFWFFGHPEVYIIALPFFGVVSEIIPVFSRKPMFGYKGLVFATIAIGALSMTVWAHHMYPTGAVLLPFFAFLSFLIAVPTGVKFFNWIGTMWRGQLTFETPMLFCIGFLITFLLGGLTGVLLAAPPIDFHVHDTYFVVAHFHYVVFGTVVFAFFGGVYYWFPKFTGRMMNDRLGKVHFWTLFIGFHTTFLVQHWLGNEGMPRRYADYAAEDGFTALNSVSSIGAFVLGMSTLPFLYNVFVSYRRGQKALGDDPWGYGNSLEWATSCPPPRHNFVTMPRIRSERPAFDLHYPKAAGRPEFHAAPEVD